MKSLDDYTKEYLAVIDAVAALLPAGYLRDRIVWFGEDFQPGGEPALDLEDLVSNLEEFDVLVPVDLVRRIERLALWLHMGLPSLDFIEFRTVCRNAGGGERVRPVFRHFPRDWDEERVMRNIHDLVTDPGAESFTGNYADPVSGQVIPDDYARQVYIRGERDGVRMLVVLDNTGRRLLAAYPVDEWGHEKSYRFARELYGDGERLPSYVVLT